MKKRKLLFTLLGRNKKELLSIFILDLILIIPGVMSPVFKGFFTDSILVDGNVGLFPSLLFLMLAVAAIGAFAFWLRRSCVLKLTVKIGLSGTSEYIRVKLYEPYPFFTQNDSVSVLSNSGNKELAAHDLTGDFLEFPVAIVSTVFYLTMMVKTDLFLVGCVLILLGFHWAADKFVEWIAGKFQTKAGTPSSRIQLEGEKLQANGLKNMLLFKSSSSETSFFVRLVRNKIAYIKSRQRKDSEEASKPFRDLPYVFFTNILLLICAVRIMNRDFSIGSYLAFESFALALFSSAEILRSTGGVLEKMEKYLKQHEKSVGDHAIETAIPRRNDRTLMEQPSKLRGFIEFKDVCFSHHGKTLLNHWNLTVKPGERAAIIDPGLSGKKAIIRLLQGLYTPDSGEITIDGIPVHEIHKAVFVGSVGCAGSHPYFFPVTVGENITLWDTAISHAHIRKILSDFSLNDYMDSLKGGYDYVVSENGGNLSGGQKETIELARAFLYSPSILIFEDATAALSVADNLNISNFLRPHYTVINATNLLYTIKSYDQIIVIEDGGKIVQGTHSELLETDNFYSREIGGADERG
jgi:ABC-type bacteriocin/lantibiotic exporter with double-glycine peptidase domain